MIRTWKTEHPLADIPKWFEDFEDNSWRNDAHPKFLVNGHIVWVDYADPNESEFFNERVSGEYKRFSVLTEADEVTVLETDDFEKVREFLFPTT